MLCKTRFSIRDENERNGDIRKKNVSNPLLFGHVQVVLAGPISSVVGSINHFRRDCGQQWRTVRTHAQVTQ